MELIQILKTSLETQCEKQGRTLYPSGRITDSLDWHISIEGYLFWNILHYSRLLRGIYDYSLIVKLYHRYGKCVFKTSKVSVAFYICNYFDTDKSTLSNEGFKILTRQLEIHGAVRKD